MHVIVFSTAYKYIYIYTYIHALPRVRSFIYLYVHLYLIPPFANDLQYGAAVQGRIFAVRGARGVRIRGGDFLKLCMGNQVVQHTGLRKMALNFPKQTLNHQP